MTGISGRDFLTSRNRLSPSIPGADVGEDDDQLRPDPVGQHLQRFLSRIREMQRTETLPHLAAKMLAEQLGDVGLVVEGQDTDGHLRRPAVDASRCRGRRTVNSVNSPTSLSTVIVPPCCWVTTS